MKFKRSVLLSMAFLLILIVILIHFKKMPPVPSLLYLNSTPSVEEGVYIRSFEKPLKNDYIVVENDFAKEKFNIKLLKIIRGCEGDTYTVNDEFLTINNQFFSIKHELEEKYQLPTLPKGTFIIKKDHILAFGKAENSLDSRYLGEIPTSKITKVLPVFTSTFEELEK